jgi:hypothetical protein
MARECDKDKGDDEEEEEEVDEDVTDAIHYQNHHQHIKNNNVNNNNTNNYIKNNVTNKQSNMNTANACPSPSPKGPSKTSKSALNDPQGAINTVNTKYTQHKWDVELSRRKLLLLYYLVRGRTFNRYTHTLSLLLTALCRDSSYG